MTRVTIIYEGIDQGFGYVVDPGATEWVEGQEYHIVDNFNFDDPKYICGQATDVRREDNNEITCEVPEEVIIRMPKNPYHKDPDKEETALVSFAAYTNGVVAEPPLGKNNDEKENGPRRVTKCVLRAVGRIPISGANPGASIKS